MFLGNVGGALQSLSHIIIVVEKVGRLKCVLVQDSNREFGEVMRYTLELLLSLWHCSVSSTGIISKANLFIYISYSSIKHHR